MSCVDDRERAWVARAHRIVADAHHLDDVRDAGGSPDVKELDGPDLRWPGCLGDRYGHGIRVLLVANVHRGFRSALFDPANRRHTTGHADTVTSAVAATRRLSRLHDRDLDDTEAARYLDGVRPMYGLGLAGGWTVGRRALAPAWEALGLDHDEERAHRVAYANVSCCQIPEDAKLTGATRVKRDVKRLCSAAHPLSGAVTVLDPQVVVSTAKAAHEHLRDHGVPDRVLTVCYHQQLGSHPLLFPVDHDGLTIPAGTHKDEWVPQVRRHLQGKRLARPGG